jgi:hypothetical protein
MIAVIYIRWLRWIDPSEALHGCPYVGQAVRALLTAENVAVARWKEENGDAMRKSKRVGLLHELKVHDPGAFDDQVVEWKQGPRSEVQAWANDRETALIAEHGGPLRDPSVRCKQTLNLTKGGKGNVNFEARDASRTVAWLHFQDEMEAYVECYETALVPQVYVNPVSGYKLGTRLLGVRQGELWRGHPDEAKRIEWLEALPGWAWNGKEMDEWHKGNSERAKAWWANADEETRNEACRKNSEAHSTSEAKAAQSERSKTMWADEETRAELCRKISDALNRPEVRTATSKRVKTMWGNLDEETRTERYQKMLKTHLTKEQRAAAQAKTAATKAAKRVSVLASLPEAERRKKQAQFDRKDRFEAKQRSKAKALLKLSMTYANKGYMWCYKNLVQAEKDGVVFFQNESGVWCARMGAHGGASSSA